MHIDVCAIPSFEVTRRGLINHYNILVPTEGLLFPVQSLAETLADKMIALAYRSRRIKPRDLWDIVWIKQRGTAISAQLVDKKLIAILQPCLSAIIAILQSCCGAHVMVTRHCPWPRGQIHINHRRFINRYENPSSNDPRAIRYIQSTLSSARRAFSSRIACSGLNS